MFLVFGGLGAAALFLVLLAAGSYLRLVRPAGPATAAPASAPSRVHGAVAGAFAGAAAAAVLAVFLLGPLGGLAASPT